MLTVIARWEEAQMPAEVEWQLWRQLRGAFKINRLIFTPVAPGMEAYHVEQFATMEEALASTNSERVFLEPTGSKGMFDIPQSDIVLITGNTNTNNLAYADDDETYSIKSVARTHLYPSEAAAIALAIRCGQ
jgi:hypothetical protein